MNLSDPARPLGTDVRAPLSPADAQALLALARKTLTHATAHPEAPDPPIAPDSLPARLRLPQACFVTLTDQGELRGCIGTLQARARLYLETIRQTRNAALRDHRFEPVEQGEAGRLRIEISLLTEPEEVALGPSHDLLASLSPGLDGVILEVGGRRATFLPQVWSQLPDPAEFMRELAQKAGADAEAWRSPSARIRTYRVWKIEEP